MTTVLPVLASRIRAGHDRSRCDRPLELAAKRSDQTMRISLEEFQMNKNISAMALAVAGAMLVVGCGGGGGG
ncbi:MAG TPA: hypothetical protein PLO71_04610 [Thauera phenylacetica]|nr:hypothetical protein [Thauera phenylacetica]